MSELIEDKTLRNRTGVFADRFEAGRLLARKLERFRGSKPLVLAIPSGGVPVGSEISRELDLDLDLLIVRKVQIPWDTEAGFGAVNMDGDFLVNEGLLMSLHLSEEEVEEQVAKTRATIARRDEKFRGGRPFPVVAGRPVMLVDDGLASGYTMRVAIAFLKKRNPSAIIVAVPTGCGATVRELLPEVDTLCCLNIRDSYPFAVASAYRRWRDLTDRDVLDLLRPGRQHEE